MIIIKNQIFLKLMNYLKYFLLYYLFILYFSFGLSIFNLLGLSYVHDLFYTPDVSDVHQLSQEI